MSTSAVCGACCSSRLKPVYFLTAVAMLAYGVAVLCIPAGFPATLPGLKDQPLAVPAFELGFAALNILAAWGVAVGMRGALAGHDGEAACLLEKIRNSLAAGFGFAAAFRIIALFVWMSRL